MVFDNQLLTQILLSVMTLAIGWCIASINHVKASLSDLKGKVADLHEWHKPDADGRMGWKGDLESIRILGEKVDLILDVIKDFIHELKIKNYSDESKVEKLIEGNESILGSVDKFIVEEGVTKELLKELTREIKSSKGNL